MVRRYRRVQYLALTYGVLLDAVLIAAYTDSRAPASSKTLPTLRKAARPIRLQGESAGAAENQLGNLLGGDGG